MALLFMDGFDAGDAQQKWTSYTGGSSSTDTRFSAGRSWFIQSNGDNLTIALSASSQIFMGFAVKFGTNPSSASTFMQIKGDTGTTTHLLLGFPTGSSIELYRNSTSTILASASLTNPLTWGTYIEVSATIADAGGTCVVKVNGTTVINFSGDTKNAGTSTNIDTITFGKFSGFTPTLYIDDLYICNSTGAAPYNTFLGDVRVHTLVADAAGSSTQFTPSSGANYTTVDELPYSATDYVSGTAGQTDLYSTSNLPGGLGVIYGVQTNAIVKKTDAGTISARPVIRSGGTNYTGTSVSIGTNDQTVSKVDQVNPATSTAWTTGDVNNAEIGIGAV